MFSELIMNINIDSFNTISLQLLSKITLESYFHLINFKKCISDNLSRSIVYF